MKDNSGNFKCLRFVILAIFTFIVGRSINNADKTTSGITPVGSIRDS